MTDDAFLIAEPKDSLPVQLVESESDKADIYLFELSSSVLESLDELISSTEITPLKALELKRMCLKLVNLTNK